MAVNLHQRAKDQQAKFDALAKSVNERVAKLRGERSVRENAVRSAREALAVNAQKEATIRGRLGAIATPADAGVEGNGLRALLVEQAGLVVTLRDAEQRRAQLDAELDELGPVGARAAALAADAASRTQSGEQREATRKRLTDPSNQASAVAAAFQAKNALLANHELDDAKQRLRALLPDELFTRSSIRHSEARARVTDARDHASSIVTELDTLRRVARPLEIDVAARVRALDAVERDFDEYLSRAAGRVSSSIDALKAVKGTPALTAGQVEGLKAANHADGVAALLLEAELADKIKVAEAAQRALDASIAAALAVAPDVDPPTDAGVTAKRNDLAARKADVVAARSAYAAKAAALDAWEVEVPPALWRAVTSLLDAEHALNELDDDARRNTLVTSLQGAGDALAAALDANDLALRGDVQLEVLSAQRRATARIVADAAVPRTLSYVRGDGLAGRTPDELFES